MDGSIFLWLMESVKLKSLIHLRRLAAAGGGGHGRQRVVGHGAACARGGGQVRPGEAEAHLRGQALRLHQRRHGGDHAGVAEQHGCRGLKEACFRFLRSPGNLKTIMGGDGFRHLTSSCPSLLNELLANVAP